MYCEVKIRSSDGSTQIVDSALEELDKLEQPWPGYNTLEKAKIFINTQKYTLKQAFTN